MTASNVADFTQLEIFTYYHRKIPIDGNKVSWISKNETEQYHCLLLTCKTKNTTDILLLTRTRFLPAKEQRSTVET